MSPASDLGGWAEAGAMNIRTRLARLHAAVAGRRQGLERLVLVCAPAGTEHAAGLPLGPQPHDAPVDLVCAGDTPTPAELAAVGPSVGPGTLVIVLGPYHVEPPVEPLGDAA